jgi:probable blue pigment (indigoidine) exporter
VSLDTTNKPRVSGVTAGARPADVLLTALGPAIWGTTYLITTALLPPDRPLLAGLLRALPAGLLLLALTRRLPRGSWWWRAPVLGMLNFGAFFPLLFFAAYRLPGGVAATVSAVQPLIVAGLSVLVLRVRVTRVQLLAALAGVLGVALLTLTAAARLDPLGVLAMVVGTALMATAIVLAKRWGSPERPLVVAGWQMTFGGLFLVPLTLAVEGLPTSLTAANVLGYGYFMMIGGVLSYALWFRGLDRLPATSLSLLSLSSPVMATLLGFLVLGQSLSGWQLLGFAVALGALVAGQLGVRVKADDAVAQSSSSMRTLPRVFGRT